MLTLLPFDRLDLQPEELRESEPINMNLLRDCDDKKESVLEEVIQSENFALKEFLDIFHNVESTENEMLGVIQS